MKVTAEPIENSQVVLNIEVEPERVSKAEQRAAARLASQVNIPGFRKGRAPRHIVEMMVGREAVRQEALDKLLPEVYSEAVREAALDPIEQPDLELVSEEPLTLKAVVPVRPTIELGPYTELRIEPERVEVPEERVDEVLASLREQHAEFAPVERPAQMGDRVTIDVTGKAGESALLDRKNFDFDLDPENRFPAPGFAERLVGATPGQTLTFNLDYPEDFQAESLRGRTGEFEVTVHAVREKHLPKLDDELAKTVGMGETLEELRGEIRRRLEENEQRRADEEYERRVIEAVVDQSTVPLPPKLVERALDDLMSRLQERVRSGQIPLDQYLDLMKKSPEELREEQRPLAERELRTEFVLHEIAHREGIEVEPEELQRTIDGMAAFLGRGDARQTEQRRRELSGAGPRSRLAHDIMESKVRARLVAIARGKGATAAKAATPAEAESSAPEAATATSETTPAATGAAEVGSAPAQGRG